MAKEDRRQDTGTRSLKSTMVRKNTLEGIVLYTIVLKQLYPSSSNSIQHQSGCQVVLSYFLSTRSRMTAGGVESNNLVQTIEFQGVMLLTRSLTAKGSIHF